MHSDIIKKITGEFSSFTKSGKTLANYILQNKNSVQFLSINALADLSGVSEASITRFCKSLGLEGYNDLKLSLAIASNQPDAPKDAASLLPGSNDAISRLLASNYKALDNTRLLLDSESLTRAVDLITDSHSVYCIGQGGSNITALEACGLFSTITNKFIHISDSHFQAIAASLCDETDTLLIFSYSAATKELQDIMKIAKESKAKIILVTRYRNSHAAKHASVVLLCGANESPLQSGSAEAKMCQLFIIECLFELYYNKNKEKADVARETSLHATAYKLL